MHFHTFGIILFSSSCALAISLEHVGKRKHTNSILSKSEQSPREYETMFDLHQNDEDSYRVSKNGYREGEYKHINDRESESIQNYGSNSMAELLSSKEKRIQEEVSFEKNIEIRFKKLVGVDDVAVKQHSRKVKPSSYIKEIFSAMLDNDKQIADESTAVTDLPVPTIRSYRSRKVNHGRRSQTFRFDCNEMSPKYSRIEIVIEKRPWYDWTAYQLSVSMGVGDDLDELVNVPALEHGNFLIFNVTGIAEKFSEIFHPALRLSSAGEQVYITKRNLPLLVVYENLDTNPLLIGSTVRKKRSYNYLVDEVPPEYDDFNDDFNCKRYEWELDMELFQWDWYIAPRYHKAGYCAGDCPFPLDSPVMNSTTYSFIKNLFHYQTGFMDEYVPRACCTPVTYYSQPILYHDRDFNTILKKLPNMKVATCGCR